MAIERVYITGAAGSGKTRLAAALGRRLGVPVVEMDLGPPAFVGFDLDGPWVVEGSFVWEVECFLARADVIVWLDVGMHHTLHRIVRRHVRLSLLGRNRHKGLRRLWHFLLGQPWYFRAPPSTPAGPTDWSALTRANHQRMLEPYSAKVVRLSTPRATRRWRRAELELERGAQRR